MTKAITVAQRRALTSEQFHGLADVPPEVEWFANLSNERTRRVYKECITDFTGFVGIRRPEEFRSVTRAHALAWRAELEKRQLAPSTIRRKLSALSSLYDYLCEKNAVHCNPVRGIKRPSCGA
jgi:integrase/recombinase XerD